MNGTDPVVSGTAACCPLVPQHGVCVPSQVPQDMVLQLCGSYSEAELSPPGPALSELRQAHAAGISLSIYMEESVQELLRDAAERFKGWTTVPGPQHTELACKKVSTALPSVAMGPGGGVVQARGSATPEEVVAPPLLLRLGLKLSSMFAIPHARQGVPWGLGVSGTTPALTPASCPRSHGLQAQDDHPLRMWKASTEVAAPPPLVLHRILRERVLWDEDLLRAQVLESLVPGVELYHYVTDSMAPHPCRDFVVLR